MGTMRLRLIGLAVLAGLALVGGIVTPAAGAHSDPAVISALDQDGRYLELEDTALNGAIDQTNPDGLAFAWLDQNGDGRVATSLADDYVEDLAEINSGYHTVVVLTAEGFGASSDVYDQTELENALDAALSSFRAGNAARGLELFASTLNGSLTTATTTGSQSGGSGTSDSGGGFGFGGLLAVLAVVGAAFLGISAWSNSRKRRKQAAIDMEEDRAEIKEQLKNNADRVISLGDRVITKADPELISTYEEASNSYQEVSLGISTASTAEEVDALDDRIDHAEWQFEVIEARLDGRPTPRSPTDRAADAAAVEAANNAKQERDSGGAASTGRSTEPPVATSPHTGRRYPRTAGTQRRRSGGLGGLGGGLGSILGSIVLGGGLGGGNRSRRSQRRTSGYGMGRGGIGTGGLGGGSSGGGRLGGGVLRRGGQSRTQSGSRSRSGSQPRSRSQPSRSRTRSRSGRSFGKKGSKGGRSF